MAAVDAETGLVDDSAEREYAAVAKGYTPFVSGDLLVAKITPCFENGKIAEAVIRRRVGFGSTEFHVIRPGASLDARYALHYLRQPWVRVQGARRMTGSAGQRRVPEDFLAALQIPVPALAEQRRIAAILDKADELRARRREALAKLDTLTQSIFLDMFGDPVRNDRQWPIKRLSEIGSVERGVSKHRPRNAPELLGGPYPFVQTGDVTNSGGYVSRASSTYSEEGLEQSRLWPAGTLCVTIAANIAHAGILAMDACFPDSVVGFRTPDASTVEYVRVWLSFLRKTLEDNAPSFAQKNINLDTLRNLPIPMPPPERQSSFAAAMSVLQSQRALLNNSARTLDVVFYSLQHRAFHGDLVGSIS